MLGITDGSILTATIITSQSSHTTETDAPQKKKKPRNRGPLIRVTLRQSTTGTTTPQQDVLEIGTQEPLQVLVDQLREMKPEIASQQIQFSFDGERLRMDQTPASLDMEDEDLIDVKIVQK
jgi:hypothetical protein